MEGDGVLVGFAGVKEKGHYRHVGDIVFGNLDEFIAEGGSLRGYFFALCLPAIRVGAPGSRKR